MYSPLERVVQLAQVDVAGTLGTSHPALLAWRGGDGSGQVLRGVVVVIIHVLREGLILGAVGHSWRRDTSR